MVSTSSKLFMKSFSSASWYRLSLTQRLCNCSEFRSAPDTPCKHLNAVGIYRARRTFYPSSRPTFSQALSALVKSIRIRRPQDAVYWLCYLDKFQEAGSRFRIARRLLIGAAEDGHSVAVMNEVGSRFPMLARPNTDILHLAVEAIRICKAPNWWHPASGGKDYIHSGLLSERFLFYYDGFHTAENMLGLLHKGIETQNKVLALAGVQGLAHASMSHSRQAELLGAIAAKRNHPIAVQLIAQHLRARTALSSDNNFLCQAAWMLAGGQSPVANQAVTVIEAEALEQIGQAREQLKHPKPIPRWCCDGLHSAGDDPRFMGVWFHMYAACLAFEHYNRLSPEDAWLPKFYCYDGLTISAVPPAEAALPMASVHARRG